jgi:hypothetical protein
MLHRSSPRLIVREDEQSWEAGRAAAQPGLPSKCPKLPLCVSRRPVCWSGALRTDSVLSAEVLREDSFEREQYCTEPNPCPCINWVGVPMMLHTTDLFPLSI